MIIHEAVQGSAGWHAAREGVLTASKAKDLFTSVKLELSKSRAKLKAGLLHEWITGSSSEGFGGTDWTEHGHHVEPEAFGYFQMQTGLTVQQCGLIYRDEARLTGCSPDGLVLDDGEPVAGLELKAPAGWTHIGYLAASRVPAEYMMQVQFSLWVTQLPRWFFMSYATSPESDRLPSWRTGAYLPPLLLEVEPEARYQEAFDDHVPEFLVEMLAERDTLLDMGSIRHTAETEPADSGETSTVRSAGG